MRGVEGVGPKLKSRLIDHFGNYRAVKDASWVELQEVHGIGPVKARRISPPKGLL